MSTVVSHTERSAASEPRTRRTRPRRTRYSPAPRRSPYLFIAPAVAFFVAVFLVPLGYTVFLSMQRSEVQEIGRASCRERV